MENDAWLAQTQEAVVDPDQRICDPHHHLWDHPDSRYLLAELLDDVSDGHQVVSTVFMECMSMYRTGGPPELAPVGETEFVERIARECAAREEAKCQVGAGIVGFADLTLGEQVRGVLKAHLIASPDRFKGIRHATSWHKDQRIRRAHTKPTEALSKETSFRRGFAILGELGLSFDAWCYHTQIPEIESLARAFPEVTIILDHFGGPLGIGPYSDQRDQVFSNWQRAVDGLAALDNVNFKLGGINMKVNGFDWHKRSQPPTSDELVAATGHYYRHCIETFGADRCMFESNFPVDRVSCSYRVLFNAFKKIAADRTAAERDLLFHGTAARVYRL